MPIHKSANLFFTTDHVYSPSKVSWGTTNMEAHLQSKLTVGRPSKLAHSHVQWLDDVLPNCATISHTMAAFGLPIDHCVCLGLRLCPGKCVLYDFQVCSYGKQINSNARRFCPYKFDLFCEMQPSKTGAHLQQLYSHLTAHVMLHRTLP